MDSNRLALQILARYTGELHPVVKVAGFEDLGKDPGKDPPEPPNFGGGSNSSKRDIPSNHEYDPKALKPLAKMLWAMSVSLGHALTAYREFTRLKSSQISPDGMLGGRGYVMSVKDVRSTLQKACESLSAVSDTVHDEINAPHWKPDLEGMGANEAEDIQIFIDEAEKNLKDPEAEAKEESDWMESENDGKDGTPNSKPKKEVEEGASKVPGAGDPETMKYSDPVNSKLKQASLRSIIRASVKMANSSLPVDSIPGGPRVDTLDRGSQTGPFGSFNEDEPNVTDQWGETEGVGNEYLYSSEWSNEKEASYSLADSTLPDSNTSDFDTKTDANDFGIGYGANGGGSEGSGLTAPDGRGVFGPASGMPNDPGGRLKGDSADAMPLRGDIEKDVFSSAGLPNDGTSPVARSDYYPGPKGNTVSETIGTSDLPDGGSSTYNSDKDVMNTGYGFEHEDNPYIKWDSSVVNYRPDYTYGRPDGSESRPGNT